MEVFFRLSACPKVNACKKKGFIQKISLMDGWKWRHYAISHQRDISITFSFYYTIKLSSTAFGIFNNTIQRKILTALFVFELKIPQKMIWSDRIFHVRLEFVLRDKHRHTEGSGTLIRNITKGNWWVLVELGWLDFLVVPIFGNKTLRSSVYCLSNANATFTI